MPVSDFRMEERVLLFCDAHEFSKIMVLLKDRCAAFIQAYYEEVGEAIVSHGGEIVKYIGDAIFAAFGPGREAEAIECAREMRERFQGVLVRFQVTLDSDLEVGIGRGQVVSGVFGHPSYPQKDIFGEKVNEVAMIMHHRGIAVTDEVRRKIGSRFPLKRLPDVQVKWADKPMVVWEITE